MSVLLPLPGVPRTMTTRGRGEEMPARVSAVTGVRQLAESAEDDDCVDDDGGASMRATGT